VDFFSFPDKQQEQEMTKLQKLFFAGAAGLLLVVSLVLVLSAPVDITQQWVLCFVAGSLLYLMFLVSPKAARVKWSEWLVALPEARIAWACMFVALILDVLVLILGIERNGATRALFWESSRVSLLSVPLATCFAALQLSVNIDWKKSVAIAAALFLHTICLMTQPDMLAVFIQLCCLFLLGIAGTGKRRPKNILLILPLPFFLNFSFSLFSKSYMLDPTIRAFDPLLDPYKTAYQVIQMLKAFQASGLRGAENPGPLASRLVLPQDIGANALPYLSLYWGNVATAVCIVLLLMLLALLLQCLRRQRNLRYRNVLLGLWGFVAFSQIWSLGAPFGLLPFTIGYGTAFLGSGFMGCLILLLGMGCVMEPACSGVGFPPVSYRSRK
jgi:cell division protein FtsW (lipid II flippase)